ncbi:PorP/SprF family type IX secretion system membrane protein [Flagellimonas sp. HMM57]|uniref:PorP/SprF family type IX secretion system membrane protein n=1 Tax=unclassified Flagellimonas TaxID=2644544 RepID=UPI0013D5EAD6|nr:MULTISPECIES: PorP/SprF family type IX secretion system membrane protein [unclassified Flagellimonas]UII75427.1 PorP/SprF family type IX secretion system membrane protein [Flagellimonas sp. HMM57]
MDLKLLLLSRGTVLFYLRQALFFIIPLFFLCKANAQDGNPYVSYDVPFQNLLKFNRFLINPTFSAVREDKSYVNLFHRNQGSDFNNNNQNYFLSYSGRLNERVGLGLSLYNQQEGVISNLGVMANYSHGIQLGEKSNLSFGVNIPYYVSSFDPERAVTLEEDPLLNDASQNSIISFQPGLNLSFGKFDFGVFAQNLVDYNMQSGESLTSFDEKTFSGHIQFAHEFKNGAGIFEDGRLLPLARARFEGAEEPIFGGGLILDLPKLGWIQGGYDEFYGASAGTGFNLNRRLSFGYNFEKNINSPLSNLGVTHEVSIAFSFIPSQSRNAIASNEGSTEKPIEGTFVADAKNQKKKKKDKLDEQTTLRPTNKEDLAFWEAQVKELKAQQKDNYMVINELIFKMDSLEQHRQRDLEKRFEMVMRMVQRKTNNERPDIEAQAQDIYLAKNVDLDSIEKTLKTNSLANNVKAKKTSATDDTGAFTGGAFKPIEKFINLDGVGKGHYIVANVFKNERYLKSFMAKLKARGLNAKYFKNPDNGLNYVYLAKYEENELAYQAYRSKMKGAYTDEIWIMHVDNPRYSNWADTKFQDNE